LDTHDTMSSQEKDGGGGGAYVPPHKRAQHHPSPAKMPVQSSPPPSEKSQLQQRNRHGGRSPAHSPTRNNNSNNNNNNSHKNHSSSGSHRKGSQSKSNSPQRYHSPTRKEDLAIQKQQMKLLQDAVDRICCINLERRPDRWQSFQLHLHQSLGKKMGHTMAHRVERIPAEDGIPEHLTDVTTTWDATENAKWDRHIVPPMMKDMSAGEVGCALSHIKLWRQLADMPNPFLEGNRLPNMMILEDDALFYSPKLAMNRAAIIGSNNHNNHHDHHHQHQHNESHHLSIANHDFLTAFQLAWTRLPEDWDIWYLGFSDRGDRLPVADEFKLPKPKIHHHIDHHHHHYPSMAVQIFTPTYGFHTHGYVLSSKAARTLLDNLPVVGPLDVWLADNQWFGLKVYCSVVEGEGWQKTGAWLITQNRKIASSPNSQDSDIQQSGRTDSVEE
jgi:GR25 family glycosyltransferase involved in LPS biosynthesis